MGSIAFGGLLAFFKLVAKPGEDFCAQIDLGALISSEVINKTVKYTMKLSGILSILC